MKRILAVLLMLAILFGFASLPTAAAPSEISFTVSDAAANKGENVIVWVSLNSADNQLQVVNLSFALSYDKECLQFIEGDSADSALTSPQIYDNQRNSKVIFAWDSGKNVLITANKAICGFRFKILDNAKGDKTNIEFEYQMGSCLDTSGNFIDFVVNTSPVSATVTFSSEDAAVEKVEKAISAIGTVEYTEECLNKILDATREYMLLSEKQKALVENYQALIEAQNEYDRLKILEENKPSADEAAKFLEDNKKALSLTVETVKLTDKKIVDAALNDYNKLSDNAKYAVHKYYVDLKNLKKKIELLQLAKDEADAAAKEDAEARAEAEKLAATIRKDYASLFKLKPEDIKAYHKEDLTAALNAIESLAGVNIYVKEYLKEEYALIKALLEVCNKIPPTVELTEAEKQAQSFKDSFFYVLGLDEKSVTGEDLTEIKVALGVYDILSNDIKELLVKEYEQLTALLIVAEKLAEKESEDDKKSDVQVQTQTVEKEIVKTDVVEKEVVKTPSAKKGISLGIRNIGAFTLALIVAFIFITLNFAVLFVFYKFFYNKKIGLIKGGNKKK